MTAECFTFSDRLYYTVCQITHWHCTSLIHSLFWVFQSLRLEVAQMSASSCLSFFLALGPGDEGCVNICSTVYKGLH